jgi:hypothetical protein
MARLACSVAVFLLFMSLPTAARIQETSNQELTAQQLDLIGPEGLIYIPSSLEKVIKDYAEATIVAEVTDFGPIVVQNERIAGGTKVGHHGLTTYKVRIREVLYNKLDAAAPPLVANSDMSLTKVVGHREAKAYLAKDRTLFKGDECVLFLWYNTNANNWSILDWHFQFRRSKQVMTDAEALRPQAAQFLPATLAQVRDGDRLAVDWNSLVDRIKQVARMEIKK